MLCHKGYDSKYVTYTRCSKWAEPSVGEEVILGLEIVINLSRVKNFPEDVDFNFYGYKRGNKKKTIHA